MRALITVLIVCSFLQSPAQLRQEVKISNVSLIPRINHDGATSMQVNYALTFKYSHEDKLKAKDSSDDHYRVELSLETDSGMILAQQGYEQNMDSAGALMFDDEVLLSIDRYYAGKSIFLPLASLRLDTGSYKVRAVLRCYDHSHQQIAADFRSAYSNFRMPKHQAVKLMIRYISVTHLDPSGEPWDYYPFNLHKSLPDIFWQLRYGTATIHTSATQWDSYEWEDQYGAGDYTFYVVKGDVLRIRIYDRDVYSPNDFIGATEISTGPNCCDGKLQNRNFNNVLRMTYALSEDVNAIVEYKSPSDTSANQRPLEK